jgi:hypothetical protein
MKRISKGGLVVADTPRSLHYKRGLTRGTFSKNLPTVSTKSTLRTPQAAKTQRAKLKNLALGRSRSAATARSPLDSASWRAPASLSAMYRGADTASSSSESIESRGSRERVLLHVYELGAGTRLAVAIRGLNAVTKSGLGAGGVFHAAIEVENLSRGLEWSYGYSADGSGVFAIKAMQHPDHTFRETVVLGRTALNREQLLKRLRQMQSDWAGDEYHLVRCNCISYCKAISTEL